MNLHRLGYIDLASKGSQELKKPSEKKAYLKNSQHIKKIIKINELEFIKNKLMS